MATYNDTKAISMFSNNPTTNYVGLAHTEPAQTAGITVNVLYEADFSSIPTNATILTASFTMNCTVKGTGNADTFYNLFRVKQAWVEATATYNTYDGTNSWQTGGCAGANDKSSVSLGTIPMPSATGEQTASLTISEVQLMIAAGANKGIVIIADLTSNADNQYGTHRGTVAYFTITYALGGSPSNPLIPGFGIIPGGGSGLAGVQKITGNFY